MRNTSRYPDKPPNGVGQPEPFVDGQDSEGEIKIVKGPRRASPASADSEPQILANYTNFGGGRPRSACTTTGSYVTLRLLVGTIPSLTHARSLILIEIFYLIMGARRNLASMFACLVVLS